jgi:uncharacterized protein
MMAKLAIFAIHIYQRRIPSRWKRKCLFEPSCSRYAELAIRKYGIRRGIRVAVQRVVRCRPPVAEWRDYP